MMDIVHAGWLGDYRLRLEFDDGVVQNLDFLPFLQRSHHPAIRAYLEPALFQSFRLEHGELVWGDYDLCFPIIDLYRNRIDVEDALAKAA